MKTSKKILIAFAIFFTAFSFFPAYAQTVEYPSGYSVDSDLDGLTDEGERQLFKTDPNNPDTDGDGYFDGAEILNSSDPLDGNSSLDVKPVGGKVELSWPWYITRATALVSFALLYVVIFLGLSIRLPLLNKLINPANSFKVHAWLSVHALLFALAHGASLLFDKFLDFSLVSVFIPFASEYEAEMVGLGTVAFYLMFLLIVTSYFRHMMSRRIWRISHFLNIILYVLIVLHATSIGTDIKNPGIIRNIFVTANAILIPLFVLNLSYQLYTAIKRKIHSGEDIVS